MAPLEEAPEPSRVEAPREGGLHPLVQAGWALRAAVNALVLGALAAFLAASLAERLPRLAPAPALLGVVVSVAALGLGLWHARRLFKSWSWSLREDDVLAGYGVLWRVSRSIPRARV
jgi:membrane protein YdbS with pleckstrin-like domain